MGFKALVTVTRSPGIESDEGLPTYQLEGDFPSKHDAIDAAKAYIKEQGFAPGEASWDIVDPSGKRVEQ